MKENGSDVPQAVTQQANNIGKAPEEASYSLLISNVLHGIGIAILILGVIAAFVVGASLEDFMSGVIIAVSSGISAVFMFGFSVVINLLIKIERNTSKNS